MRLYSKAEAAFVTIPVDDSDSQLPFSALSLYLDSDYPLDSYMSSRFHRVIC
jgi:hypothetical protein